MSSISESRWVKGTFPDDKQRLLPASEFKYKSRSFVYTQGINPHTSQVSVIILRKDNRLTRLSARLERKKIVKVNIRDPKTKQAVQYYMRVQDICNACGLTDKDEDLKKAIREGKIEEFILKHNYKAVAKKIDEFIKPSDLEGLRQLKRIAQSVYGFSDLRPIMGRIKILKSTDKVTLDSNEMRDFVNKVLNPSVFNIKQTHHLDQKQYEQIERLALYVPAQNLEKVLNDNPSKTTELLNTFYKAAEKLENGLPQDNLYVKKIKTKPNPGVDYSFTLTPKGDFIISFDHLAEGSFKKVYSAVNVTKPDKKIVKIVVRGDKAEALREEELKRKIYKSKNPYMIKPSKISILTKTSEKRDPKDPTKIIPSEDKYIYFEKRMDGDGRKIDPDNLKGIGQICHDLAKTLAFLQDLGYVHCDVKIMNILISQVLNQDGKIINTRGILSDFGLTQKINENLDGGTLLYLPREYIEIDTTPTGEPLLSPDNSRKVHPSLDSYSLGITILGMLDKKFFHKCMDKNPEKIPVLGFLNEDQKKQLFEEMRDNAFYNSQGKPITFDEFDVKMSLIELAEKLTNTNPRKRPSCKQAYKEIIKIFGKNITTDDPS